MTSDELPAAGPERDDELVGEAPGTGDGSEPQPAATAPRRRGSGGGSGSVLAAAMLAVGEIIEPQNTQVEVQVEVSDDVTEPLGGLRLDFGDLEDES